MNPRNETDLTNMSASQALNKVMYDLAEVLGYQADDGRYHNVNPNKLLAEAVDIIWRYNELRD